MKESFQTDCHSVKISSKYVFTGQEKLSDITILQTPTLLLVTELLKTNECTVKTNVLLLVGKRNNF